MPQKKRLLWMVSGHGLTSRLLRWYAVLFKVKFKLLISVSNLHSIPRFKTFQMCCKFIEEEVANAWKFTSSYFYHAAETFGQDRREMTLLT